MKQNKVSLSSKQYAVPFVLITSLFFMWGFARAILDVLNKHFQNELDITITLSSLIQVTTYLGYFLLAIPADYLSTDRAIDVEWCSDSCSLGLVRLPSYLVRQLEPYMPI